MVKYCKYCGKSVKTGANFCTACGAKIESRTGQILPAEELKQEKPIRQKSRQSQTQTQRSQPQQATYRRPVAFRLVAIVLIIALAISAWRKLLPGEEFVSPTMGQVVFTSSDFKNAAAVNASVAPENNQAVIGAVKIDMGAWNLKADDEIIMKSLTEKTDSTGNVTIRAYDFTLASGQSQFTTSVLITIPVTTTEDEDGSVVYLNEDKGEWEYIAYDLTEDGKSYIVYVPHFSTVGEKKVKKYVGTETDIRTTSGDMETKGSSYQYMSFTAPDGSFIPLNERSVYMSDAAFNQLYLSINTEELKNILLMANLPTENSVAFALGTLNNASSVADSIILLKGLDKCLSQAGKIRLSGCMGSFGAALTAGRIAYQANYGGSFSKILWENKLEVAESLLGGLSFGAAYIGAAGAASVFSVAAAIVFAGSLVDSYFAAVTQYDSYEETVYHFFLDKGMSKIDIIGLTSYDYMDKLYPDGKNFEKVLKAIYELYADKPKELDSAVSRMYYGYAGYFWNYLSPEERAEFANKEYAGDAIASITKWTEPSEQEKNKYIERTAARLASETEPMLRALAYDALAKMKQELYQTLKREIEPYLNQTITFVVKDKGLKSAEYFSASPYSLYDIEFDDKTGPQYAAKHVSLDAYTDEKYTPAARNQSDIIYRCTMYHYIQMGCPTSITFKGDTKTNLPPQTINFEIDDSGGGKDILVNLVLEAREEEEKAIEPETNLYKDDVSGTYTGACFVSSYGGRPVGVSATVVVNQSGSVISIGITLEDEGDMYHEADAYQMESFELNYDRNTATAEGNTIVDGYPAKAAFNFRVDNECSGSISFQEEDYNMYLSFSLDRE